MVGHTNGANTSHPLYFVSQHERYIIGYYVRAFNLCSMLFLTQCLENQTVLT